MVTVNDVYAFLNEIAPFEYSFSFDNVGILVGNKSAKVDKVLLSLDLTSEVLEEANQLGVQLVITHHPVIFDPVKSILSDDLLYRVIKSNISVISAHTNLDIAENGVNFHLAKALGIKETKALSEVNFGSKKLPFGVVGSLDKKYSCKEFAQLVKRNLNCDGVRYLNLCNKKIKKVAVGSGACGELVVEAKKMNADVFVTGEIKHHELLFAKENSICVVDVGHYKSENVVIEPLALMLHRKFSNVMFFTSTVDIDSMRYL